MFARLVLLTELFSWVSDVLHWLAGALAWIRSAIAWTWKVDFPISPTVRAAITSAVLLGVAALAVRWARLRWLSRYPRIQISPFAWTGADGTDRDAIWITSLFRERLGSLRLEAHDPLPGSRAGDPLVDIVEGVAQGVGQRADIGRAFGQLFRAIWPHAAYQVWGTLRPKGPEAGRISVQLADRKGRVLTSVAADSAGWETSAQKAAVAVAGALYPSLAMRHRGPWTTWSETVPAKLVGSYFEALEHEKKNRLEEAMGAYREAVRLDPLNPNLMLRIGLLQERLALYIDAWSTYRTILGEDVRAAWKGPDRRTRLLAQYRLAILLSNRQVARQWVRGQGSTKSARTERDEERERLRAELTADLATDSAFTRGAPLAEGEGWARATSRQLLIDLRGNTPSSKGERRDWIRTQLEPGNRKKPKKIREINEFLEIVALHRLEQLDASMRRFPRVRPRFRDWWLRRPPLLSWFRRTEFATSGVAVSKLLVRTRIMASATRRRDAGYGFDRDYAQLAGRWPLSSGLRTDLRHLRRALWRRWDNRRKDAWQMHYNAACAVAAALFEDSVPEIVRLESGRRRKSREEIARRAVEELEQFAHRAGSALVAAKADWVAIDDPDLEALAGTEEFRTWANRHLPCEAPDERPKRIVDVGRHTARVIVHGASAFAQSWRVRADRKEASAEEVVGWWAEERDAWRRLRVVCHERRSWGHRLDGLKALQAWLRSSEQPGFVDFSHEDRAHAAAGMEIPDELFTAIEEMVGDGNPTAEDGSGTVLAWAHGRFEEVKAAHLNGASQLRHPRLGAWSSHQLFAADERQAALRAARIWTSLAEALEATLDGHGKATAAKNPLTHLQTIEAELRNAAS